MFRGGLITGTSGGKAKLWLLGDASNAAYIQGEHTGGGNTCLTFGTANRCYLPDQKMVIGSNGNVSIGTTDFATYKLNVNGNSFFNGVLNHNTRYRPDDNFACNKINFWGTGGNYGFGIDGGTLDYFTGSTHRWYYGSGGSSFGTQAMTLTNNNLSVVVRLFYWHSKTD